MTNIVKDIIDMPLLTKEKKYFDCDWQFLSDYSLPSFMDTLSTSSSFESIVGIDIGNENNNDIFYDAVEFLDDLKFLSIEKSEDFTRKSLNNSVNLFTNIENDKEYFSQLPSNTSKLNFKNRKFSYLPKNCVDIFLQPQKINGCSVVNSSNNYMQKKPHLLLNVVLHPAFLKKTKLNNILANYNDAKIFFIQPTEADFKIKMKLKSY